MRDKLVTEPDAYMNQMLEVKDRIFKTTLTNMMKVFTEKEDNVHEQMENFSKEMDSIRNNQVEIL